MFFIGYPKNTTKYTTTNGWVCQNSWINKRCFIANFNWIRSINSRFNGTSATECGSSFRCNNQWSSQGYYPSTDCTSSTPHHHHHYPPQYSQQFTNGGNSIHYNCRSTIPPPHGRLQKSLSFAFQTPSMMNEPYHQSYQNQLNSINYPERSYSRWWLVGIFSRNLFLKVFSSSSFFFVSLSLTDVICIINNTNTLAITWMEWVQEVEAFRTSKLSKAYHIPMVTFIGITIEMLSGPTSFEVNRDNQFKCLSK